MGSDRMDGVERLPTGLRDALAARVARITKRWDENYRTYLFADSPEGPLFARTSRSASDRAVFSHEIAVRKIVGDEGVLRTPPIVASGTDWVLEVAIESEPLRGRDAIAAVVEAADELQYLTLPDLPPTEEHAGAMDAIRRRLAVLRAGVGPSDLIAARRILREGSDVVTSHGDFHGGNVFFREGALWVVDWEMAGRRPAGYDLMQFWASVESDSDRTALFESAVALLGPEHESRLARLRYALLVRTIADKLGATRSYNRDAAGGRRLLALLPDVRRAGH